MALGRVKTGRDYTEIHHQCCGSSPVVSQRRLQSVGASECPLCEGKFRAGLPIPCSVGRIRAPESGLSTVGACGSRDPGYEPR